MQFGLPPLAGALVVNLGLIDIVCMYSREETVLARYGRYRWGGPSVATTLPGFGSPRLGGAEGECPGLPEPAAPPTTGATRGHRHRSRRADPLARSTRPGRVGEPGGSTTRAMHAVGSERSCQR